MVSARAKGMLSTLFLVVGALLVGDALNGGIVAGRFGIATAAFVGRLAIGIAALAVGVRLRTPVEEYVAMPSDDPETADPETGEGTEFDPELSPVGGEIEGAERADEHTPEGEQAGERGPGDEQVSDSPAEQTDDTAVDRGTESTGTDRPGTGDGGGR